MKIILASLNPIKLAALKETLHELELYLDSEIAQCDVFSGVSEQPLTLDEAVAGAKIRAKKAFEYCDDCQIGVGIESGAAPLTHDNQLYVTNVSALYDGQAYQCGFSSSFLFPFKVTELMLKEGMTMGQAMKECGYTAKDELGKQEGTVGVLSNMRLSRKRYLKQSLFATFIPQLHKDWYR